MTGYTAKQLKVYEKALYAYFEYDEYDKPIRDKVYYLIKRDQNAPNRPPKFDNDKKTMHKWVGVPKCRDNALHTSIALYDWGRQKMEKIAKEENKADSAMAATEIE